MSQFFPIPCSLNVCGDEIPRYNSRIKIYPDGSQEVLACERPIWGLSGWEERGQEGRPDDVRQEGKTSLDSVERSMRRARAQVKDLALCTPFKYFVTLTLDAAKIDRHDMAAIVKQLNTWLDNRVRRNGLSYVLVPERHQDGAIHFHGFFNDALPVTDSGTVVPPGGGKPRRPRTKAQRAEWLADGGRLVYNLPAWSLGFTTALELYGEYPKAVAYVCKYIGKAGEKIGGRWYYSGGELGKPEIVYCNLTLQDVAELPGSFQFAVENAFMGFAMAKIEQKGEVRG